MRLTLRRPPMAALLVAPMGAALAICPASAQDAGEPTLQNVVVQTAMLQDTLGSPIGEDSVNAGALSRALPGGAGSPGTESGADSDGFDGGNATTFDDTGSGSFDAPIYGEPVYGDNAYSPMGDDAAAKKKAAAAKKKQEALDAQMKSAYAGVFYANDFSYLRDPAYNGPYFLGDNLKGMLGGTLDVGGEARVRYHNENGFRGRVPGLRGNGPSGLGLTGNDDQFWLTRIRAFANYRVTENIRIFGEYLYADSGGEVLNNRPIEENRGEAQNLFVDAKLYDGEYGKLVGRAGRQELLFGEQRLVSPLDWANTRRTFDGYRGTYSKGDFSLDGFFTNVVDRSFANEDQWDSADSLQDFYGVYASMKNLPVGVYEAYYLGYNNDNPGANFDFHTIGTRLAGKRGNMLYEVESGTQFGNNNDGSDHDAYYFIGGLGRQLELGKWKPTVWGWYDYASGEEDFDDVARGDDGFDHLFPLAHKYNGFMDLFGRRNLHDINAQFITPLGERVKLLLWYHHFVLAESTTPYDVVMNPYNTNVAAGDDELGQEIDVLFFVTVTPRQGALIGYSHFNAGDYYSQTANVATAQGRDDPVNSDADFFYFQYQWSF